jgi:hypothetical protein
MHVYKFQAYYQGRKYGNPMILADKMVVDNHVKNLVWSVIKA